DAVVVARGDDAVDAAGLTGARADERLRAESLRSQGGRHRPALAAGEAVVPALSDTSPSRRSLRSQTRGASGTSPDAGPEPAVAPREPALLSRATSIDTRSRQCAAARGAGTAALVDASRNASPFTVSRQSRRRSICDATQGPHSASRLPHSRRHSL